MNSVSAILRTVCRYWFSISCATDIASSLLPALIYENETLPRDVRLAKINRRLNKCKPFNPSYCLAFRNVIARLDLLLDAVIGLISFISLICEEGNSLSSDHPRYLGAIKHENASDDEEFSMASSHRFQNEFPSFSEFGYSSVDTSLSTTPPDPATPTWKLRLGNKYAIEQLYVGSAELEVFANTLGYARVALEDITNTINSINDLADLADEMLEVFDDWTERLEMWDMYRTPEAETEIWEDALFS